MLSSHHLYPKTDPRCELCATALNSLAEETDQKRQVCTIFQGMMIELESLTGSEPFQETCEFTCYGQTRFCFHFYLIERRLCKPPTLKKSVDLKIVTSKYFQIQKTWINIQLRQSTTTTYPIVIKSRRIVLLALSKAQRALALVEDVWRKLPTLGDAAIAVAQHDFYAFSGLRKRVTQWTYYT